MDTIKLVNVTLCSDGSVEIIYKNKVINISLEQDIYIDHTNSQCSNHKYYITVDDESGMKDYDGWDDGECNNIYDAFLCAIRGACIELD